MTARKMLLMVALTVVLSPLAYGQGINGTWVGSFDSQIGEQTYTFELQADGETLTGRIKTADRDTEVTQGTIDGNMVAFVEDIVFQGMPLQINFEGTLDGNELRLRREVVGIQTIEFVATRN